MSWVWLALVGLACLWMMVALPARAQEFLEPEQAFQVGARMLSADQAEVRVRIAPNYYAYREPIRFSAEGATLGPAQIPQGKVKFDENFQKDVETYRGELRMTVPVQASGPFTLTVRTQGCADAGLCYPPMDSVLRLEPVAGSVAGATGPAADSGGLLGRLGGGAAAGVSGGSTGTVSGDDTGALGSAGSGDDGLIDGALRSGRLWQVASVFFGLGLLLSLTPCVLPMLPILSSLIVGSGHPVSRGRGLAMALSYSLGMAIVYTALGVAAGLAGEGLAAALQTPWAIAGFALMLVLLSLAMFDVYELRLPASLATTLTAQSNRMPAGQAAGVFAMGGLSALMVSPCVSAPLAGALLFISQTGDAGIGALALFTMAMGMSVPLLVLGASAGQWLPRSGAWMIAVKRLFGLIMLGVALWMARPVLPSAWQMVGWGLLLLAAGVLWRPWRSTLGAALPAVNRVRRLAGALAMLMGLLQLASAATGGRDPLQPWAHWVQPSGQVVAAPRFTVIHSTQELDAALASANGRTVVLDFYADWCVSCKEMERFTFSDAQVAPRLGAAVLLKADVTANSESERALLRRFRLFGPPGLLFFGPGGQEVPGTRVIGFVDARRFAERLDQAGL